MVNQFIYLTLCQLVILEIQPRDKQKTVFRCRVMGGRGCGKTTFCRSLVLKNKVYNGQMDGWMDGRIDGWMDGWIDGWMDGWMEG